MAIKIHNAPLLYNIHALPDPERILPGQALTEWRQIDLRPGLWFSRVDIEPGKSIRLGYQKNPALIDFAFILTGKLDHRLRSSAVDANRTEGRIGPAGIGYFPGREGIVEAPGGKTLQILHVHVDPNTLRELLRYDFETLPPGFRRLMESGADTEFLCRGAMDPTAQTVAREVFNGGFDDHPRRLYLEAKALELISLQISWMTAQNESSPAGAALSPSERDRIHAAREALIRNPSEPPTLRQLSVRFSLSVNKLQAGFRCLFGDSVYGCLREHKMQQARSLFEESDMNVSEVAWSVGYVNVSHFTRAYKRRFGLLPKVHLRHIRKRRIIWAHPTAIS